MVNRVGVLALQGNYNQHKRMLDVLGIKNILVQYPRELENCDLLIIPGGESTAISKQIERNNFRHPILNFAKTNSVFGTCAGMILLSSSEKVTNLKPLSIMDFKVDRNAFGRQVDSFSGNLCLEFDNSSSMFICNNPTFLTHNKPWLITFSPAKFEIRVKILFLSKIASTIELDSINKTKKAL